MSDIRFVCISDLHLGADNSLLTCLGGEPGTVNPDQPSEVLLCLATCLKHLVRHSSTAAKPTLILNGDALELALAQDHVALMAFERFVQLLFPSSGEQLFQPEIIFNPGNHDHHLWETARETQYVEYLEGRRSSKPAPHLPLPWHTTKMIEPDLVNSALLNAVIRRHRHLNELGVHVGTVYPNLCFLNSDQTKCVIFSHGHFVEPVYMLMTSIGDFVFPKRKMPTEIWDIESENFAWIDFFWSAMGRSGAVGRDLEQVYDTLLVPDARKRFINQLARAAGHHWLSAVPGLGEWLGLILVPFFSVLFRRLIHLEKRQPGLALSPATSRGLQNYIEGPLAKQLLAECPDRPPLQTTFVFGHTHKPFSAPMNFKGFPQPVHVYNSGGWVVDTMTPEPAHGGAILLIDEQLNVTSLRMYNETATHAPPSVRVEAVDTANNPLYSRLVEMIRSDRDPWLSFSAIAAKNVEAYHHRFRRRLNALK